MEDLTVLWLDDQREPYDYFAKIEKQKAKNKQISGAGMRNSTFYDNNVFNKYNVKFDWVKNIEEFSNYIKTNGMPKFISFDRDLTPKGWMSTHNEPLPDGLACIQWLKKYCQETNQNLPKCFVHSANTKRIPEMEAELGAAALKQEILKENKNNDMKVESYIKRIVKDVVNKQLYEAQDRDAYVSVRPNQGSYDVTNANDLRNMFFDPSRKINNGEFVTITYVESGAVQKTFNNFTKDADNNDILTGPDTEKQGRDLNKPYLNDFFDSDDYKKKMGKKRGGTRPFAVFTTVTQQVNWASMNYGKGKAEVDDVFKNASDADLNDFTQRDADFMKRVAKYKEQNPQMADEIDQYVAKNSFPRDIIDAIRNTKLANNGGGWSSVDGNPYVSGHENGNEALRLTKHSELKKEYQSYVLMADGTVKRITQDEFFYLQKAFGGAKKTNTTAVETSIRKAINAINKRYEFRDYLIPQIAKMSFTIDGKPVTYKNHELQLPGTDVIIDADDFLTSAFAESKKRKTIIKESEIRNVVRQTIRKYLK